jgi:hypothetical protein
LSSHDKSKNIVACFLDLIPDKIIPLYGSSQNLKLARMLARVKFQDCPSMSKRFHPVPPVSVTICSVGTARLWTQSNGGKLEVTSSTEPNFVFNRAKPCFAILSIDLMPDEYNNWFGQLT